MNVTFENGTILFGKFHEGSGSASGAFWDGPLLLMLGEFGGEKFARVDLGATDKQPLRYEIVVSRHYDKLLKLTEMHNAAELRLKQDPHNQKTFRAQKDAHKLVSDRIRLYAYDEILEQLRDKDSQVLFNIINLIVASAKTAGVTEGRASMAQAFQALLDERHP